MIPFPVSKMKNSRFYLIWIHRLFLEGLISTEGNLCLKIDWASFIVGSKFTVFALFYFVFEGNFPSTSPRGAYIWRGDLTEGFLRYPGGLYLEGLINRGAYFQNFTVSFNNLPQVSQKRKQY